jgi:hypothetical protein
MSANYSVSVYLVELAYGGPEEGGWWYDTGNLVKCVRMFQQEKPAVLYMQRMQRLLDCTLNKGRRPLSSVASNGRYFAMVEDGVPPKYFPAVRPHYE